MILFESFIYDKEKQKTRRSIIFVSFCSLKPENFGRILTVLKIFTAYSSLVANFLIFVVKFFLICLVSIYDWWRVEEKTRKHGLTRAKVY